MNTKEIVISSNDAVLLSALLRRADQFEVDMSRGRISVLSPVGRALLGRRAGHVLDISLPSGRQQRVKVMGVRKDAAQGGGDD